MPRSPVAIRGPLVKAADTRTARLSPVFLAPKKPKVADAFYSSAAWIELRNKVRRETRDRCQWPNCTSRGRWIDHIIERRDGGADLDRSNLWNLCSKHHGEKTARERERRKQSAPTHGASHP